MFDMIGKILIVLFYMAFICLIPYELMGIVWVLNHTDGWFIQPLLMGVMGSVLLFSVIGLPIFLVVKFNDL